MSGRFLVITAVLLSAGVGAEATDEIPAGPPIEKPRLALVLGGGGARGVAHIGALRALEEAGIPVDAIAANSMGAVVGGIYATGRTTTELEEIVLSVDWESTVQRPARPAHRAGGPPAGPVPAHSPGWTSPGRSSGSGRGLLAEHRVNRFLIEQLAPAGYAAGGDFDRLPIPFRCVATDLDDGDRVVLANGDLALAVRASMSIPVAFPPVEWKGRRLVDGLVVDNLPVDVARELRGGGRGGGGHRKPSPGARRTTRARSEWPSSVMDLLTERRNADFAAEADVLVRPDLGDHSASDYSDFDVLIEKGYEATKAAFPQIREAGRGRVRGRAGARGRGRLPNGSSKGPRSPR